MGIKLEHTRFWVKRPTAVTWQSSPKKWCNGTLPVSDALLPSTSEWCRAVWVVSQVAVAVIVYGTLIRRSSGEVTDIHMKPARSGMTLVEIPLLVSSFVLSWRTEQESNRSTHDSGSNGLPL